MVNILIKHKVADYDKWKATFDKVEDIRRSGGEKSYKIMHPENEPNNLIIHFEWDNIENANTYFESPDLKNAMEEAGVIEAPDISFINIVDSGTL